MTQAFTQGEPNLVNEAVEISSEISLSLPKTLSLPSSPSISQISTTSFPPNFSTNLDDRYTEHLTNNTSLRLDLNTFVAPPPLLSQHLDSNRLYNWALNRLQYRHDIHKDIQEHNIQILTQDNLTLKFEKTVKLNNLVHHSLPLNHYLPHLSQQKLSINTIEPYPFYFFRNNKAQKLFTSNRNQKIY